MSDDRQPDTIIRQNPNLSSKSDRETREKYTSRDITVIAVFGALWGLMEITVGVTLKGLRIPMSGALLTSAASIIFLTGRYFVRQRGSILMMGAVAALLKIFSIGTVIAGPFIAIVLEALMGEIIISLLGINRLSYMLTPVLLLLYTIIHPFIAQGILFGDDIYRIYLLMLQKIADTLHIGYSHLIWVALSYAGIHVLLGLLTGLLAFALPRRVESEMLQSEKKTSIPE